MTRGSCVAGVVLGAIALVSLVPMPVAGQSQASATQAWDGPRTPWGDPDLQGVWDYGSRCRHVARALGERS